MIELDEINERHGTTYRAEGAYPIGEVGAFRLVDDAGRRFVLKYADSAGAAAVTAALAPLGYPVPRYVIVEDGYSIQTALPGEPLPQWRPAPDPILDRFIELNELQEGRAVVGARDWPAKLIRSVTEGFEGYMVLETLRGHSSEARELLERCQSAVANHADALDARDDVVHWDFTSDNVLAEGGDVTGVVDWEGTVSGDRLFDLVTFAYYSPGDRRLRAYVVERIGESGLSAYLAHLCVRQSDWSLRHHGPEAGRRMVNYSLRLARGFSSA